MADIGPFSYVEVLSLLVFAALAVAGTVYVADGSFSEDFNTATEYVRKNQTEGFFVLVGALTLGSILPGPLFLVVIASGYAFDSFWVAVVGCYIGSLLGASLNFGVTRVLLRGIIQRHVVDRYRTVRAVDNVVRQRGLVLVTLLRLPYLPFAKMSFVLSCTGVLFKDYLLGTAIGIIPAIFVMVGLGTGFQDLANNQQLPGWFMVFSALLIVGVFGAVLWYASHLLDAEVVKLDEENGSEAEEGEEGEGAGEQEPLVPDRAKKAE